MGGVIHPGLRGMCLGWPQGVLKRRKAQLEVAQGGWEGHHDLSSVDDIIY